jgi:hypothetical protein
MGQPLLHSDAQHLDRSVGNTILYQNGLPYVTATQIAAATNTAGLKTIVTALVCHADQEGLKPGINRALDIGNTDGSLSDTNLQAASTAATLAANTYADPSKNGPCDLV